MLTTKADRCNEIPDKEIGVEHKLPKKLETACLAQSIFVFFKRNSDNSYHIAENMPFIFNSRTTQLRYVNSKRTGKKGRLFTIVIRERDRVINLKTKGSPSKKCDVIFRDEIEYQLPFEEWTPEKEQQIKLEQGNVFGVSPTDIILKRKISKQKLKIRVENNNTNRVYTIGVISKVRQNGLLKKCLSIDYVGREFCVFKENEEKNLVENIIIEDIQMIQDQVLKLIGENIALLKTEEKGRKQRVSLLFGLSKTGLAYD